MAATVTCNTLEQFSARLLEEAEVSNHATLELGETLFRENSASVLASLLLGPGPLGTVPLVVKVAPRSDEMQTLVDSGLAFALANRTGRTEGVDSLDLGPWRQTWTPRGHGAWLELFSAKTESGGTVRAELFSKDFAGFVNPHLAAVSGRRTEVGRVIRNRLGFAKLSAQLVENVGLVVDELIENIRDHGLRRGPTPTSSLLTLRISPQQIIIQVLDNGPGIKATAASKIGSCGPADGDLIMGLLTGRFPNWPIGRGFGLTNVWQVASQNGGELLVASDKAIVRGVSGSLSAYECSQLTGVLVVCKFSVS